LFAFSYVLLRSNESRGESRERKREREREREAWNFFSLRVDDRRVQNNEGEGDRCKMHGASWREERKYATRGTPMQYLRGGGDDATRGDDSQETRDTHETTTGKERKRERERERIQNGLRKDDED